MVKYYILFREYYGIVCHKQTCFCIVVIGVYIPPKSNHYGYDSENWFDKLVYFIA